METVNSEINKIHWFDLDGVLWQIDAKWQIIDKNDPGNYILRISQYEGALLQAGFYKNDGHYVQYNGADGWLSKDLWDKIQSKKQITENDLGYSWREFNDTAIIEKQADNVTFYINTIEHLKGTKDTVNLLTARGNKDAHELLLNKLNRELEKLNIFVEKAFFVNDPKSIDFVGNTSTKKTLCILQNAIGYMIEENRFVPKQCDKYDESHFYDDEEKNIEAAMCINKFYEMLLENTMPALKDKILEDSKKRSPKLFVNLVSSNSLKPFESKKVDITT